MATKENLEILSPEVGAKLLKRLGVKGSDSELLAASREIAGADQSKGGPAWRVIAAYADWLGHSPEAVILRMLGLFDRPADPKALAALRAKPVIPWLTEPLMDLKEEEWQQAVSNLRESGLLLPADPDQPDTLDAHPLVRAYFRDYLQSEQPEGWQAGNQRLSDLLEKEAPDLPSDTTSRRDGPVRPPET